MQFLGIFQEEFLSPLGGFSEDALLGPSTTFEVDIILEEDELGNVFSSGFKSEVLVADFTNSVLPFLREYEPVTDSLIDVVSFSENAPNAMPAAQELLSMALTWATGADGRVHF